MKHLSRRPGCRKILPGPDVICFLYKLFKLTVIQRRIRAIFGEQLFVAALLDDVALLHEQDDVRIPDGGETADRLAASLSSIVS